MAAPPKHSPPMSKSHRDLLILDTGTTADPKVWKIVEHPHAVVGKRRGFEVRLYHDATWPEPYFVAIISLQHGWVMDGATAPTEAAAQAEAIATLASFEGAATPTGRA